jgi:hypothetical protein
MLKREVEVKVVVVVLVVVVVVSMPGSFERSRQIRGGRRVL